AAPDCEPSATCLTSSIFTPGQPVASIERNATERAPLMESTPTSWPDKSLQAFPFSPATITQSGLGMPYRATSGTPALDTWVITGGVGDHAMSTSPETTARAAAVPLSNGRISTSAPCFLKKPSFSAA